MTAFPKPVKAEKPFRFSSFSNKRKPMKKLPPRRISERKADRAYLSWLATQACCVSGAFRGDGVVIDLNHAGPKPGMALKCSDLETLPMEHGIHMQWTEYSGRFKSWTREQRREWADARIVEYLDRFIAWVPERIADLDDELGRYVGASQDDLEIAADIGAQIEALRVCSERVRVKLGEVVARIGETA